jgi:hypothetical protein
MTVPSKYRARGVLYDVGGGQKPVNADRPVPPPVPPFYDTLIELGIKTSVWSVLKAVTNYDGPCMRVARVSDSAVQDFGFVDGVLDVDGITTWLAGSDGLVDRWYDQGGNGHDLFGIALVGDPYIALNGVVQFAGVKPAVITLPGFTQAIGAEFPAISDFAMFTVTDPVDEGSGNVDMFSVSNGTNGELLPGAGLDYADRGSRPYDELRFTYLRTGGGTSRFFIPDVSVLDPDFPIAATSLSITNDTRMWNSDGQEDSRSWSPDSYTFVSILGTRVAPGSRFFGKAQEFMLIHENPLPKLATYWDDIKDWGALRVSDFRHPHTFDTEFSEEYH